MVYTKFSLMMNFFIMVHSDSFSRWILIIDESFRCLKSDVFWKIKQYSNKTRMNPRPRPQPKKPQARKIYLEREISTLKAQLDQSSKDLKEAQRSVTYYQEQFEQFRSELTNRESQLRELSAQTPRRNPDRRRRRRTLTRDPETPIAFNIEDFQSNRSKNLLRQLV